MGGETGIHTQEESATDEDSGEKAQDQAQHGLIEGIKEAGGGGWVGRWVGWVEENEAVRRCWNRLLGGWVERRRFE